MGNTNGSGSGPNGNSHIHNNNNNNINNGNHNNNNHNNQNILKRKVKSERFGGLLQDREYEEIPFLKASLEGDENLVAKLLKEGADPNDISDRDGWYALHCAALGNNERIIRLLIAKGAQPEPTACDKYVRIRLIILVGKQRIMSFLCSASSSYDTKGRWTPLHYAASNDSLDAAKCLIELGAQVDTLSKVGSWVFKMCWICCVRMMLM